MSAPRDKGTRAETAACRWLSDELGIVLNRSPLRGVKDQGDIVGLPATVVEVKNTRLPEPKQWATELCREINHAEAREGVILWSPPGVGLTSVDSWIAFELSRYGVRDAVPHIGPLSTLHKYVYTMDTAGFRTRVQAGTDCLEARVAWRWLMDWRERFGHLLPEDAA